MRMINAQHEDALLPATYISTRHQQMQGETDCLTLRDDANSGGMSSEPT